MFYIIWFINFVCKNAVMMSTILLVYFLIFNIVVNSLNESFDSIKEFISSRYRKFAKKPPVFNKNFFTSTNLICCVQLTIRALSCSSIYLYFAFLILSLLCFIHIFSSSFNFLLSFLFNTAVSFWCFSCIFSGL
jgi:hypothetical protein